MRFAWWVGALLVAAFVVTGCESGDREAEHALGTTASHVMPTSHAKVAGHDEVAGVCGASQGLVAVVDVGPDTPNPRCQVVARNQELEVRNKTSQFGQHGREVTIRWRNYPPVTLQPGQHAVFAGPFGGYLLPGSHDVAISIFAGGGAELVMR